MGALVLFATYFLLSVLFVNLFYMHGEFCYLLTLLNNTVVITVADG